MTRLVIAGIRGRMGQSLAQLVRERDDVTIVAGVAREKAGGAAAEQLGCPVVLPFTAVAEAMEQADVLVDFSSAAGTAALIQHGAAALKGRALVTGTTGLGADVEQALDDLSYRTAVLSAANFSIGVNLLLGLAQRVAAALPATSHDVEIVEAHHGAKTDAPSGTALAIGRAVAAGRGQTLDQLRQDGRSGETGARRTGTVGFHAVRGGAVVGEHRVLFLGARDTLELRHEALDRTLFADGAVHAAVWLAGRPAGRYHMNDVLGL